MSDIQDLQESPRKRQKLSAISAPQLDGSTDEAPSSVPGAEHRNPFDSLSTGQHQTRKESEVGITEYVNPDLPGFSGILKKRYTDFLVNEILPSGQVVHLDNLKLPARAKPTGHSPQTEVATLALSDQFKEKPDQLKSSHQQLSHETSTQTKTSSDNGTITSVNTDIDTGQAQVTGRYGLSPDDGRLLASYFDEGTLKSILALHEKVLAFPDGKARSLGSVISAVIIDRELRTKIHQAMRRIFSSRLETSTNGDGAMVISAAAKGGQRGNNTGDTSARDGRPQLKGKLGWQELGGEHLHFSLYKENKDTMEVIAFLARQLKIKPKSFQFAGTKDRRGVTVQRVSVYRVHADKLMALNRSLRGSKIGGYEYQPHGLELGDLTGNEFIITLRDCGFPGGDNLSREEKIKKAKERVLHAMTELSMNGYINYYGLQRFGTFSARTDTIGIKMLQGDFKGACDNILSFSDEALAASGDTTSKENMISSDDIVRAQALHSFNLTGQGHPALDKLPRKYSAESNIIMHLSNPQRSSDYRGALQTIPRNLRLMYVHAYQSLVWNMVASERWKRWGHMVVEGDLVLVNEHKQKARGDIELDQVDESGELVVHPAAGDRSATDEDHFERARALSKEEAESGEYNIFDVVLPTPGYDILYPANTLADYYREFMASERGGNLDPYDMRRTWKDISLSGSYRKLLGRPGSSWSYEVEVYSKDDEQLVETDLDKLTKKGISGSDRQASLKPEEHQDPNGDEAKKLAVILKLQLGSSQYATMALRELMKPGGVQTFKPDFGGGR